MAYESWLVERAREELEMLESQHPTRFNHLKLELKSLISQPNSSAQLLYFNYDAAVDDDTSAPISVAPTKVSSNRKRKTEWSREKNKAQKPSSASGQKGGDGSWKKSDSSVEAAIRRAEACLKRIQQVKQSLLFC